MNKEANVLQSVVFKRGLMVFNFCIIAALVGYIIFLHTKLDKGRTFFDNAPSVTGENYTEEEIADMMARAEDTMVSIYSNLLVGTTARFSDGSSMSFLENGKFDGYFDSDHRSVSDYFYVVSKTDDGYLADVNISAGKNSPYIRYKLLYDENSNFMLYYPEDDMYIALEY